ncbi:hypothetical protein AAY473_026778 [Plecturocebus cupreus]
MLHISKPRPRTLTSLKSAVLYASIPNSTGSSANKGGLSHRPKVTLPLSLVKLQVTNLHVVQPLSNACIPSAALLTSLQGPTPALNSSHLKLSFTEVSDLPKHICSSGHFPRDYKLTPQTIIHRYGDVD